tara:strand:+ start:605 stop:1165 length:561 start_codon:yes stop_codon:yes gene_type:complete
MAEEKTLKQELEKAKEKLKAKKEESPVKEKKIEKPATDDEEKIESKDEEKTPEKEETVKKEKKERIGILNIYTTFNNTIMSLTDLAGNSISRFSGGQSTNQDRLKANPTIAMFISQKIAEEAKDNGITGFYVKVRAGTGQNNPGPGAHAAIKSLTRAGFKILSIMDTTRTPRGGPKKKGGRRGRRV